MSASQDAEGNVALEKRRYKAAIERHEAARVAKRLADEEANLALFERQTAETRYLIAKRRLLEIQGRTPKPHPSA